MGALRPLANHASCPATGQPSRVNWGAALDEHLGEYRVEPVMPVRRPADGTRPPSRRQALASLLAASCRNAIAHRRISSRRWTDSRSSEDPATAGELFRPLREWGACERSGIWSGSGGVCGDRSRHALAYVSAEVGQGGQSARSGQPWADKMLALPDFLTPGTNRAADPETLAGRLPAHEPIPGSTRLRCRGGTPTRHGRASVRQR